MGQKPTRPVLEASNATREGAPSGVSYKNSTKTEEISSTSSTRLAWSSKKNNTISIAELETKQEFANFQGVIKVSSEGGRPFWTHVKEIANTGLLVSVHHSFDAANRITDGDVTYNTRSSMLGAIPVTRKISYHLYNFSFGKAGNIVKLIRKSRWRSQYPTIDDFSLISNAITTLDFNPNGETIAIMDRFGKCLLSDTTTDDYRFHMDLKMNCSADTSGRCRWSPNTDECLLFIKYDCDRLNILDAEKKALTLKTSIQTDKFNTYWIDVCPNNGNLLASGGDHKAVKIFDKRVSKIVQTFDNIHTSAIYCVRWNPSGDMLASASDDQTVAVMDVKTGKKLFTGYTSDKSPAMSVCFI